MLCISLVCLSFGMKAGKLDTISVAIDIHFNEFGKFNLGLLILLCQKEPQEDGRGGEGGRMGNIGV